MRTSSSSPTHRSVRRPRFVQLTGHLAGAAILALTVTACDSGGPSLEDSMKQIDEKGSADAKPVKAKPRPTGMAGPTDAEFKAWDRKDPEGEKHLYKWDKAHLEDMLRYWHQLECFHENVKQAGADAFGAEPGSEKAEQWFQFKRAYVAHLDGWQKRLFAEQPRIQEKSKFVSNFLEAHELVMAGYLRAYNNGDETELKKQDAHWAIVVAKNKKYVKSLGAKWPERDMENPKVAKAHADFCQEAMTPPDRSGKAKKRRSGGGKRKARKVEF
ncbi:MAG: hypothetical protein ACRBN8_04300 [Nannocystales bacterium]